METLEHVVKLVLALGLVCLVVPVVVWALGWFNLRHWDKTLIGTSDRPIDFIGRDW